MSSELLNKKGSAVAKGRDYKIPSGTMQSAKNTGFIEITGSAQRH